MLIFFACLSIAGTAIPAVTGASVSPVYYSPERSVVHTRLTADSTPILLTSDLLARWTAVRTEFNTWLKAHPASKDSTKGYTKTYAYSSPLGPGSQRAYDFSALTAHMPAVAAIFVKYHMPPDMYMPIWIAMYQAIFTGELSQSLGKQLVTDTTSVAYQNIVFALAHRQQFAAVDLDPHVATKGCRHNRWCAHRGGDPVLCVSPRELGPVTASYKEGVAIHQPPCVASKTTRETPSLRVCIRRLPARRHGRRRSISCGPPPGRRYRRVRRGGATVQ